MPDQEAVTQKQVQDTQQITAVGAQAAQEGKSPEETEQAMKEHRDKTGADISDEIIEKIASLTSAKTQDELIEKLKTLGAFDPAPEPVQAPETAPPPPGEAEAPASAPAAQESAQEAPRPVKKTWADAFLGYN